MYIWGFVIISDRLYIFGSDITEVTLCTWCIIPGGMWYWFVALLLITFITCCYFPLCNYELSCGEMLWDYINILFYIKLSAVSFSICCWFLTELIISMTIAEKWFTNGHSFYILKFHSVKREELASLPLFFLLYVSMDLGLLLYSVVCNLLLSPSFFECFLIFQQNKIFQIHLAFASSNPGISHFSESCFL